MKKIIRILMVAMTCMLSLPSAIAQQDFVPDEVIVKTAYPVLWDKNAQSTEFVALFPAGSKVTMGIDVPIIPQNRELVMEGKYYGTQFLVKLLDSSAASIVAAADNHKRDGLIEEVWFNHIGYMNASAPLPMNDPALANNYYLRYDSWAISQGAKYTGVQHAWGYVYKNTEKIIVAVLDGGLNFNHQDIQGGWVVSSTDTIDGIDNDLNGYIDDYQGWDFVNNDNDPTDDNGGTWHGSHVTGIIAARNNNNKNICGIITDTASILVIKAINSIGSISGASASAGYYYALSKSARVINMSFGFASVPPVLMSAIATGVMNIYKAVPIAAVGNNGVLEYQYPASGASVLTVGATYNDASICPFSNHSDSLDIMAVGGVVRSLVGDDNVNTQNLSGTSQATPFISAVVHEILKTDSNLTVQQVIQKVRSRGLNGSFQPQSGWGYFSGLDTMHFNDMMPDTNVVYTACTGLQPLPPTHYFTIIDSVRYGNAAIVGHSVNTNMLTPGTYYYKLAWKSEPRPGEYYLDTFQVLKFVILPGSNQITPSVTIAQTAGSNPMCANGTLPTFTATPTNSGSNPFYQWEKKANLGNWMMMAGATSVTYTPSSVANNDSFRVVVTPVAGSGCYTSPSATSNAIGLVVNPTVTPSVNIVATPSGAICQGTSVTFTATPTNGGASPSYQWKVNGVNTGANSSAYNYIPVNADQVQCVLTSNVNCATTGTANSNTIIMGVSPGITPTISIAANPGNSICSGTPVTFTASITNGGTTPVFQWKKNGTNAGTNSSSFAATGLVNGDVITCVLTSNAGCLAVNNITSNAISMTVNASVTPTISISSNPSSPVCAGTPVTFTAAITNGGTTPVYQWKVNGSNVGTNSASYMYAPGNGDNVQCVLTSNAGCLTGNNITSNSITMAVNPNIAPSISIGASANNICLGTAVTFTATANPASANYQWKVNGVNVGTNSGTYSYNPVSNDQVTCVLTTTTGCYSPSSVASNTITMNVITAIAPTASVSGNAAVCSGVSTTYTVTTNVTGGTYQWKVNNLNVGTNSNTYSYTPVNGDIIKCEVTTPAGCFSTPTVTSNAMTIVVTSSIAPTASINASANNVCAGVSVTFTATTNIAGGNYQWKVNGVNAGTNSATYSYVPVNNDQVTCDVSVGAMGCFTQNNVTSNAIQMIVLPNVTPSITLSGPASSLVGSSVTINANITNGPSTYSLNWTNNGNPLSTTTVPSVTYNKPAGTDNIQAALQNTSTGCFSSASSNIHVVTETVGVKEILAKEGLSVYPNPFEDKITVKGLKKEDRLMLLDMVGRQVKETVIINSGKEEEVLNLGGLAAGNYLLRIVDKNGKAVNVAVTKR